MIQSIAAQWVIIGHSERRQYFGETNDTVLKKTVAALEFGLKPKTPTEVITQLAPGDRRDREDPDQPGAPPSRARAPRLHSRPRA